jgi:outer membrane biosynthesis protein TonB
VNLPRFSRALLALLPPERREEFLGDLLEEAELQRARHGEAYARRWVRRQVLHSWPSLVVARLRRAPVAVAATAGGPPLFLPGSRFASRSLAVGISIALHVLLFGYLSIRGAWTVEELSAPQVVVTFWNGLKPGAPPLFGEPQPAAREKPASRSSKPTPAITPRAVPVSLVGPSQGTGTGVTGDPNGDPLAKPCVDGACAGGDPPPPHYLPPKVGEKACVACQTPQLPPAYLRLGNTYAILVRICANKQGTVDSVKVLQGLGGAADDSVVATVATWRYSPYQIEGRPVPFCYNTRFVFSAQ